MHVVVPAPIYVPLLPVFGEPPQLLVVHADELAVRHTPRRSPPVGTVLFGRKNGTLLDGLVRPGQQIDECFTLMGESTGATSQHFFEEKSWTIVRKAMEPS